MDVELVNKIKKIAIIALVSDDELVESIVLKGGNAIDLAYRKPDSGISRASYDLDFSIEGGDFSEDEATISTRIEHTLEKTFLEQDYVVMNFKFSRRPGQPNEKTADFWGGYLCTFRVIEKKKFDLLDGDGDKQQRNAIIVQPNTSQVFEMEFSKFEYIGDKREIKVDNFSLYVYTPEMIVFEKLRAICQQLPGYGAIIGSFKSRARARDFYDIHLIMEMHGIDPTTPENKKLIEHIFEAKRVPLDFIKAISNNKARHADNWNNVVATLSPGEDVEDFDFYFDYVVGKFSSLTFL